MHRIKGFKPGRNTFYGLITDNKDRAAIILYVIVRKGNDDDNTATRQRAP